MLSVVAQITWSSFLSYIHQPPGAMWFILILSGLITLLTTILNRVLINPKEIAEKQAKITEHQNRKKELEKLKEENPKKYQKEMTRWQRQDKPIQKMQQKMSLSRLKPTCITFLPMFLIFYLLRHFFGVTPVAIPPMNPSDIPLLGNMMAASVEGLIPATMGFINYTTWYFLCNFALSTLVQKAMGLAQPGGGFGNMLGGQGGFGSFGRPK